MVEEDARVTVSQIELQLVTSLGSVCVIFHEKLHLRSVGAAHAGTGAERANTF